MPSAKAMRQYAPFPQVLADLVAKLRYRPGWTFTLADIERGKQQPGEIEGGLTLVITTKGYNGYHPELGETYQVNHFIPVPPATYDERSWTRWLFDTLLLVERHEACEFFRYEWRAVSDAERDNLVTERPYAPSHGPGNDPYIVREVGTVIDQRTSFRGTINGG